MAIPAVFSQKIGRPVMLRINRYEENYIGRARPGFQGWVKMGFTNDGKLHGDRPPAGREGWRVRLG